MRGLNIRISFVKARLLSVIGFDEEKVNDALLDALDAARSEGFKDGIACRDMPVLYRDEPELINFWEKGYSSALEQQCIQKIIDSCDACKDSQIGFCQQHFGYC